jgi:hypothetical protein
MIPISFVGIIHKFQVLFSIVGFSLIFKLLAHKKVPVPILESEPLSGKKIRIRGFSHMNGGKI